MKCPIDGGNLVMSERNGVEINYCLTCRGVLFDRGELDKIIDRATSPTQQAEPARREEPRARAPQVPDRRDRDHDDDRDRDERYRGKRKESWLSGIFDF